MVKDAVRYPLLDWRKFLIFGILFAVTYLYQEVWRIIPNYGLFIVLALIGLIVELFVMGYLIKVIESSLTGVNELPEFKEWGHMLIDGFKVAIAAIIYFLPAVLIMQIEPLLGSASGILDIIVILYAALVIPIFLVAMANMVNYGGEFELAFRFRGIFEKISVIGRLNFIKWYLITVITFFGLYFITFGIYWLLNLVYPILGEIIQSLIMIPFICIFLARSVGLFYNSE